MARGYTRKQTGAKSRAGVAKPAPVRRTLNPWGNMVPKATGRRANAVGQTVGKSRHRASSVRKPTPAPDLWDMKYSPNDPLQWPIEGGKRGSASGMTQAKVDVHNAAVEKAYNRAGY